MTKKAIRELLENRRLGAVCTSRRLAEILRLSIHTVWAAKSAGDLRQIQRNCYALDDVVEWLYANPKYLTRCFE